MYHHTRCPHYAGFSLGRKIRWDLSQLKSERSVRLLVLVIAQTCTGLGRRPTRPSFRMDFAFHCGAPNWLDRRIATRCTKFQAANAISTTWWLLPFSPIAMVGYPKLRPWAAHLLILFAINGSHSFKFNPIHVELHPRNNIENLQPREAAKPLGSRFSKIDLI